MLKGSTVLPEADFTTPPSNQGHSREDTAATIDEEEQQRRGRQEADRHFVSAGPSWKEKVPPFRVLVHSPSKLASLLSGAYTVYNITSFFHSQEAPEDEDEERLTDEYEPDDPIANVTVQRRFSHFVVLHTALTRRLPGIALPPLPEKQYAGRFSDDFVEARRGDLERYINKIVRHPVARYAEILTFFLSCESDAVCCQLCPVMHIKANRTSRNGNDAFQSIYPCLQRVLRSTLVYITQRSTLTRRT